MKYLSVIWVIVSLAIAGCEQSKPGNPGSIESAQIRPLIVASNYPLYFFADSIAGDSAEVILPGIEGDPANWRPDEAAIAQLQAADLVLLVGAGYESWLQWLSLSEENLLDTSASIQDRLIPLEQETVHQHGPQGEHSHAGMAFTVWLDPTLAMEQARAIEKALSALSPENSASYSERLSFLIDRLKELDDQLTLAFEKFGDQPLLFSHPVYQYLERRYTLNGASVHWEPEESPSGSAWIELGNILRDHPAQLMIWEGLPLESTSNQLLEQGVSFVVFETASNRPGSRDYFEVMAENIRVLSAP